MEAYLAGVWVRKFRTFKDTYYRFPIPQSTRRINVLLGKNGAGKSSLLDAIKQISAPPEANDAQTDVFSLVKINASFTGHEIWSGEPHAQMNSLLYGGPENLKVPAELFIHGTPLVHSQINDEEELSKIAA